MHNKEKPIKIRAGHYKYKGFDIRFYGYYPPDKCVWWEAVCDETGCADYHNTTLKGIIQEIDNDEKGKKE